MSIEKIKVSHSDDTRLALLEQAITNINQSLVRIEQRLSEDRIGNAFILQMDHGWYFRYLCDNYNCINNCCS